MYQEYYLFYDLRNDYTTQSLQKYLNYNRLYGFRGRIHETVLQTKYKIVLNINYTVGSS